MNKTILYIIIGLVVCAVAYYILGETGVITSIAGLLGFGGVAVNKKLVEKSKQLEELQVKKKEEIANIQEKIDHLEKHGVPDLDPKNAEDYWKNQ